MGKGGEDGAALADTGISPENKQQKSGVLSIEMGRLVLFISLFHNMESDAVLNAPSEVVILRFRKNTARPPPVAELDFQQGGMRYHRGDVVK